MNEEHMGIDPLRPPNTTMKTWDAYSMVKSPDFGEK
jgi:hypothetical protein